MSDASTLIHDWLNLPPGAEETSLWAALHDAQIVSIQSDLLQRTVTLHIESDHLIAFHDLPLDLQFHLRLEGVQSARVNHYAVWPGEFSIPAGASHDQQQQLVAEYQSKWREESLSWNELEAAVTTECKQVVDISDATLAKFPDGSVALHIIGLLNYADVRAIFLRAERLALTKGADQELGIRGLTKMGEEYWDAFEKRAAEDKSSSENK